MIIRAIIYLLAMLTGISAAEAARPVSAVPAAVGQAYAAAAVKVAEKTQVRLSPAAPSSAKPLSALAVAPPITSLNLTTPVLRHDVILG
jgi:hypothetical protein